MFERRAGYQLYAPALHGPLPVILFLHGAGESGTDGVRQTTVGLGPAVVRDPSRFPALIVFPQASHGYGWRGRNLADAVAALDDVIANFDCDVSRVYITGISMGGYGAWLLAWQQPERFAAVVPVCGGLDRNAGTPATAARRLAKIPHWVFHGADDEIIPATESRAMVAALRAAGGNVRYTEYAGVRHNSWERAYGEKELIEWMLAQRRSPPLRITHRS
jgi:predicted peptidase